MEIIREYEPNLVKAAWNIFGESYRYRQLFNEYRAKRKAEEKELKKGKQLTMNDLEECENEPLE